jgi:photosystem II stability/assembly factor-like uncharacterized protein
MLLRERCCLTGGLYKMASRVTRNFSPFLKNHLPTAAPDNNGVISHRKQDSGVGQTLNDIFFINAKEGWAAGERGTLLHTADGGATWQSESLKMHGGLTRLFFITPDCGWLVGTNGAIFKYN